MVVRAGTSSLDGALAVGRRKRRRHGCSQPCQRRRNFDPPSPKSNCPTQRLPVSQQVESVPPVWPVHPGRWSGWRAEEAGPFLLAEAVALAPDVEDVAVMEQAVEDGGG